MLVPWGRYVINAPRRPRMTPHQPTRRKPCTHNQSSLPHRDEAVVRAARVVPADVAIERGNQKPVCRQERHAGVTRGEVHEDESLRRAHWSPPAPQWWRLSARARTPSHSRARPGPQRLVIARATPRQECGGCADEHGCAWARCRRLYSPQPWRAVFETTRSNTPPVGRPSFFHAE